MTHRASFATAIGCIDGRIQTTLNEWVRQVAGVEYVDTITWPGANGALADGEIGGIRRALEISASAHGSSSWPATTTVPPTPARQRSTG